LNISPISKALDLALILLFLLNQLRPLFFRTEIGGPKSFEREVLTLI
jgi:hypothetical protein